MEGLLWELFLFHITLRSQVRRSSLPFKPGGAGCDALQHHLLLFGLEGSLESKSLIVYAQALAELTGFSAPPCPAGQGSEILSLDIPYGGVLKFRCR